MFFHDTDDFRKYVGVNADMDFQTLSPILVQVDKAVLKPYLGEELVTELQEHFDTEETFEALDQEDVKTKLIDILREASSHLALAKWIPLGQVMIDGSGIGISTSTNRKTAFQWQIKNAEQHCLTTGNNAIDEALRFIINNIEDFDSYSSTDMYRDRISMFVPSAKEFTKYFSALNNSMLNYMKLLSIMRKVEDFEIKSVLLDDLFAELKLELIENEIGVDSEKFKLIEKIKPAVVNLTIAKAINELSAKLTSDGFIVFDNTGASETIEKSRPGNIDELSRMANACKIDGLSYLGSLKTYLEKNKSHFSTYTSDASYEGPEDAIDINNGDLNFFAG